MAKQDAELAKVRVSAFGLASEASKQPETEGLEPLSIAHSYPFCHREEQRDAAISFPN